MSYSSDQLCESKYDAVRRMAYAKLRNQSADTYQGTDLAHDALLRLKSGKKDSWTTVDSFMTAIAGNLKRVLIDRFRHNNAQKRIAPKQKQPLGDREIPIFDHRFSELEVNEVIERYGNEVCPIRATLIRMRLDGYGREETMRALEISSSTYDRYLQSARKRVCIWLLDGVASRSKSA